MMNRLITLLIIVSFVTKCEAQKIPNIGVFAPVMMDSVIKNGKFNYYQSFPKFIVPGLHFLQGAQIALDSLSKTGIQAKIYFFDSKSTQKNVTHLIDSGALDSMDMIIGAVKEPDYSALAAFAFSKEIPFISTSYPNDGGIKNNPYLVIINSTLRSHCESLFAQLLQNHGVKDKIYLVRKTGSQEDRISNYFKAINEQDGKPLLKIETVWIDSSFEKLTVKLDTTLPSVIIGGSLDEKFASDLLSALEKSNKKKTVKIFGMPNWDGFDIVKSGKSKSIPIYFSTVFYNSKSDSNNRYLNTNFTLRYKGLPSEAAFKGYSYVFYFVKLYSLFGPNIMRHLNDLDETIFSRLNFLPVHEKGSKKVDYYENKNILLLKSFNGKIEPVE